METQYLLSFLLALLLSLLLIALFIKHSARLGLVDDPSGNARKLHTNAMPRSGGLGIILAAAIAVAVVLPADSSLFSFFLGALVIIGFGLLDDYVELKPVHKLAGQALGVGIAMAGGMVISEVPLLGPCPVWFSLALTFVFVMGVINGVNFSDGMDGLAAGITLMALVLLFILGVESGNITVAAIAIAICAALIGFLRFNTHPARIFMGDAGSQFLGFVVAWLAITVSQSDSSPMTTLMPLLILGIPVMDILQVVPVRIKKKLPLPGPDKEHLHHQIAKLGFHQYEVVAIIYVLQAVLLGTAYVLRFSADTSIFGFYVVFTAAILGTLYLANVQGWQLKRAPAGHPYNRRNQIFRNISVLHPYTGKFFGVAISLFLAGAAVKSSELPHVIVYLALAWAVLLLGIKFFSRNRWPLALARMASFTATGVLVYGITLSTHSPLANTILDGSALVLVGLLLVAIRTTRKEYFWLTTQDLLVLFFVVLLAPNLPGQWGGYFSVGELLFRTCVVLYACEYVLARGEQARGRMTTAAIAALFLLGVNL
jgi:UDP-GlcNAc:undecaprenyl-phosphate GlcNAc-1-phosphate transferase